jgi:signal peptidase I
MRLAWAALLVVLAAVAARRWLDVVEVRGRSMAPTLLPGDRLLVARAAPRVGGLAVAADPRHSGRELVKRVAAINPGGVELRGDNLDASTDARTFGHVELPRWRVLARYWPPARIGAIPAAPARLELVDEGGEPACAFPEALIAGD